MPDFIVRARARLHVDLDAAFGVKRKLDRKVKDALAPACVPAAVDLVEVQEPPVNSAGVDAVFRVVVPAVDEENAQMKARAQLAEAIKPKCVDGLQWGNVRVESAERKTEPPAG